MRRSSLVRRVVDLHNAVVNNPLALASAFRTEQNRLQKGGIPGPAGVSYVPPAPKLCAELMDALLHLANRPPAGLDPLVLAGIVSFPTSLFSLSRTEGCPSVGASKALGSLEREPIPTRIALLIQNGNQAFVAHLV